MSKTKSRSPSSNPDRFKWSKPIRSSGNPKTIPSTRILNTNGTNWCTTRESWIPTPFKPTLMDTSNSIGTLIKRNSIGTLIFIMESFFLSFVVKKQYDNKSIYFFFCVVFIQRITPVAPIGLWTLSPRFSRDFTLSCAHDPFFPLVSGFPYQNT